MKKVLFLISVFIFLVPSFALADIDLSGMDYDDLIALKQQVDLLIMQSDHYKEITLTIGLWKVGQDIPAGTYILSPSSDYSSVVYGSTVEDTENSMNAFDLGNVGEFLDSGDTWRLTLSEGKYVYISHGPVTFISDDVPSSPDSTPDPLYAKYPPFDYRAVSRNPELYEKNNFLISGNVIQVLGSRSEGLTILVSTSGYYDDVVLLYVPPVNAPEYNILEDDKIEAFSVFRDMITYETVLGAQVTSPLADVDIIRLAE